MLERFFAIIFCCLLFGLNGQAAVLDSLPVPRDTSFRVIWVPIAFYTPDTRWGGGAAGVVSFRGEPLRSSITFSVAYTQRKQLALWFPFQYFGKKGQYRAFGELGWYRYLYQFFGIGNQYPNSFIERYTAEFPRVQLSVLRNAGKGHWLGLRYWTEQYKIIEKEAGGLLDSDQFLGAKGGFASALGGIWVYDTRNSPFYPNKGALGQLALTHENPAITGSDFKFSRFLFDFAKYYGLGAQKILVFHALTEMTWGAPPFFLLPSIGGTKKLRGYFDSKFRDKKIALLQSELRMPLFWRFKYVVFAGAGAVWGTSGEKARIRPNAGAGLRFELDPRQQIHIRLDYGIGDGSSGFYLTVGEAF
jgi:outer membrane protein assembly factor BamA